MFATRIVRKNTSKTGVPSGFTGEETDRLGRRYEFVNGHRVAKPQQPGLSHSPKTFPSPVPTKPLQSPYSRESKKRRLWADITGPRTRPLHEEEPLKALAKIGGQVKEQWPDLGFLGPLAPAGRGLRSVLMASSTIAAKAVSSLAKERGVPPEKAQKVAQVCGYLDFAASVVGLSHLPIASLAYVVTSTARNPLATLRTAKHAVKYFVAELHKQSRLQFETKGLAPSTIAEIISRAKATTDFDYWTACFLSAMDETHGDVEQSLFAADGAAKGYGKAVTKGFDPAKHPRDHGRFTDGVVDDGHGHAVEHFANPSHHQILRLLKASKEGALRGLAKDGETVVWDAEHLFHEDMQHELKAHDADRFVLTKGDLGGDDHFKVEAYPEGEWMESHPFTKDATMWGGADSAAANDEGELDTSGGRTAWIKVRKHLAKSLAFMILKSPLAKKRHEGDVWQGPSGNWFTLRNGRSVPTKAPGGKAKPGKGPKNEAAKAETPAIDAKDWTPKQLARELTKESAGRFNVLETAHATGWATNGRFMVKLSKEELAGLPSAERTSAPPIPVQRLEAAIPKDVRDVPAQFDGTTATSSQPGSKDKYIRLSDGKRSEFVNANYFATIKRRYPDAEVFLNSEKEGPVLFRSGGESVAALVPIAPAVGQRLVVTGPDGAVASPEPVAPKPTKASGSRSEGETWQTNGRWYRQSGGKAVRIPRPKDAKPAEAPTVAEPRAPVIAAPVESTIEPPPVDSPTERKHAAMRAILDDVTREWERSRDLSPRGGTIALGSADFDHTLKAVVGDGYLRALRDGKTPDEALAAANADGLEAIKKWNAGGYNGRATVTGNAAFEYKRREGAAETIADSYHRRFLMLSTLPPEPTTHPLPETPAAEPEEAPSPVQPPKADETPRQTADRQAQEADGQYEFARDSTVPNVGEDLKGSARHKRNEWRGLAEAEADGSAVRLVHRETLLANEPADIGKNLDDRPLTTLAMHLVLKKFPPKPKVRKDATPEQAAADRSQYVEAYRALKAKAETVAATESDPLKAIEAVHERVGELIDAYRGVKSQDYMDRTFPPDRFNPTANALVDLWRKTSTSYREMQKKTNAAHEVAAFRAKAKAAYAGADVTADHAERVGRVLEGMSVDKAFDDRPSDAREPGEPAGKRFNEMAMYLSKVERKGGPTIDVADPVKAAAHLTAGLGLRGVQFGNSVSDEERRHHVRQAAEAFADLTDILGIDPRDASLGGVLGLAIGARGHGSARAHYEPGSKNINLTRTGGVGTLAHEWGHAFDHAIAGGQIISDGSRLGGDYMSDRTSSRRFEKRPDGGVVVDGAGKPVTIDYTADSTWKAHDDVRQAWKTSGYQKRLGETLRNMVQLGQMSKAKANGYWNSNIEKLARTFERYVQRKLHLAGRENTYLTGISDAGFADGLWPNDAEVDHMTPAFDSVFAAYRGKRPVAKRLTRNELVDHFTKSLDPASTLTGSDGGFLVGCPKCRCGLKGDQCPKCKKRWVKGKSLKGLRKFDRPENYDKIADLPNGRELWAGANDWENGWIAASIQKKGDSPRDGDEPIRFLLLDHKACPCGGKNDGYHGRDADKACRDWAKTRVMEWAKGESKAKSLFPFSLFDDHERVDAQNNYSTHDGTVGNLGPADDALNNYDGVSDRRWGCVCPRCGGINTGGIRGAQYCDGVYCGPANAHCGDCDNGFSCNVDTGDTSYRTQPWGMAGVFPAFMMSKRLTKAALDEAVKEIDREPSVAMKEAGNHRMAHVTFHGLPLTLERAKGQERTGVSREGKAWSHTMTANYGYIKRTESEADGDHVDIYLADGTGPGEDLDSELVFVVNQNRPDGTFDEHKCCLGWTSAKAAKAAYLSNYAKDWTGFGSIVPMTLAHFKRWIAHGDTGQPLEPQHEAYDRQTKRLPGFGLRSPLRKSFDPGKHPKDRAGKFTAAQGIAVADAHKGKPGWEGSGSDRIRDLAMMLDSPRKPALDRVVDHLKNYGQERHLSHPVGQAVHELSRQLLAKADEPTRTKLREQFQSRHESMGEPIPPAIAELSEPAGEKMPTHGAKEIGRLIGEGGHELFRGVKTTEQGNQLRDGEPFAGQGDFGNGMYFAKDRYTAEQYAAGGENEGVSDGDVVRAVLHPKAKIVRNEDIQREYNAAFDAGKITTDTNIADFARDRGIDAIKVWDGAMNVINPAMLHVHDERKDAKAKSFGPLAGFGLRSPLAKRMKIRKSHDVSGEHRDSHGQWTAGQTDSVRSDESQGMPKMKDDEWFKGSKIAKSDGRPKVVYTGQPKGLDEIPPTERNELPLGHAFFTTSKSVASQYAGTHDSEKDGSHSYSLGRDGEVYRAHLAIKKPMDLDGITEDEWAKFLLPDKDVEKEGYSNTDLAEALGLNAVYEDDDGTDVKAGYETSGGVFLPKNFDLKDAAEALWMERSGSGDTLEFALRQAPSGQLMVMFPEAGKRYVEAHGFDGFVFEDAEMGDTTIVPFDEDQIRIVKREMRPMRKSHDVSGEKRDGGGKWAKGGEAASSTEAAFPQLGIRHLAADALGGAGEGDGLKRITVEDLEFPGGLSDDVTPLDSNWDKPIIAVETETGFRVIDGFGRSSGMKNGGNEEIYAILVSLGDLKERTVSGDDEDWNREMYARYAPSRTYRATTN